MDYYTVHDDVNGQLGFVPHSTSAKSAPIWGQRPGRVFEEINFELPDDPESQEKIGLTPEPEAPKPSEKKESGNAVSNWWGAKSTKEKIIFIVVVWISLSVVSALINGTETEEDP